jgi:hypothetical protein
MALKFGSAAWRKKYPPGKKKRSANKKRKTAKRKTAPKRKGTKNRATSVRSRNPPKTIFQARYKGQSLGSYDTKAEANRAIARARREEKAEKKWEEKQRKKYAWY